MQIQNNQSPNFGNIVFTPKFNITYKKAFRDLLDTKKVEWGKK